MIYFAIFAYLAALSLFLIFMKGASKLNNADDERLADAGVGDAGISATGISATGISATGVGGAGISGAGVRDARVTAWAGALARLDGAGRADSAKLRPSVSQTEQPAYVRVALEQV